MKVDFIICGTQKGGTTALDAYLRKHPEICMANKKELHFFDDENAFCDGAPNYSPYHSCFSPKPSHKVIGEATPIYMYWHYATKRIWQYNPNIKLIIVLRNPIDRAYSHWNMEHLRSLDSASFWEAIQNEDERCRKALPYQHRVYSYIGRGFYLEQLRRLWAYFSKTQVLVLRNEELKQNPNKTLQKVCEFLGVEILQGIESLDVHALPYTASMSKREKDYLRSVFEYEIRGIERVLEWDCSNWLSE